MAEGMTIGQLSRTVGLSPRTVRFYERIGLLPEPRRTAAGYRVYEDDAAERLRFVLKCKLVGLSLDEIAQILAIRGGGRAPCTHVLELIDRKLADVARQLAQLQSLKSQLCELRAEADATMTQEGRYCSIIEHHGLRGTTASTAPRS